MTRAISGADRTSSAASSSRPRQARAATRAGKNAARPAASANPERSSSPSDVIASSIAGRSAGCSDHRNPRRVHTAADFIRSGRCAGTRVAGGLRNSASTWRASMSELDRGVLPIPDVTPVGLTTYDAKDPATSYPPIRPMRPPEGAPNVLIVLIDDVGFGAASAFGGPIRTPVAERLATSGLKYNRFHTTALCSPTRAALLSGRNHHTVGMGGITEIATGAPGYNSIRPNTCAPLAETLKLNGYSTAQFGKCHEVPVWETSPMGPFDNWPTGQRLRVLLRLHRRRGAPVLPRHLRGHRPGRAREDTRRGLPLHGGHDRQGDRVVPRSRRR